MRALMRPRNPHALEHRSAGPVFRAAHGASGGAADITDAQLATHATQIQAAADGTLPEWVHLLPTGTFGGVDGRGPYTTPLDAHRVIELSMERALGGVLRIDCGHLSEPELFGNAANVAEAAGWIVALEARGDGIHGKVEWTPLGDEKVRGRLYRWLSPVFYHDADGVVLWLAGAGLTNRPNITSLKALNSQHQEHRVNLDQLKAAMSRLLAIFALPETTESDALVARVQSAAIAEQVATKATAALSLAGTPTADDVVRAINAARTPDASRYIPVEQHDAVVAELRTVRERETTRVVQAAMDAGKVTPALRDWAIAFHARDPQGFAQFVEKSPTIVEPGTQARRDADPNTAGKLSDTEKAICASLGVTEEDFLKNKPTTEARS